MTWTHTHTFILATGERVPVEIAILGNGPQAVERDPLHRWVALGGPLLPLWRYVGYLPDSEHAQASIVRVEIELKEKA